jgi:hypothetical protein
MILFFFPNLSLRIPVRENLEAYEINEKVYPLNFVKTNKEKIS